MKKQGGVTLIELMIVVVIVGIITSIAVPAYSDHVIKGKIAQGVCDGTLGDGAVDQFQHYLYNEHET